MEEGSLRIDANISVRKKGETALRNKTEIKNMNSFNFMEKALNLEAARQIRLYEAHPDKPQDELVRQETYRWDPERGDIVLMRRKEGADDYRYFPEPDLPPVILTESYIEEIRKGLPELPLQRERRYISELEIPADLAFIIVSDKKLADYFDRAVAAHSRPRMIANWITIEFPGRLKELGQTLPDSDIPPEHIGKLVALIDNNTITGRMAKEIADEMVASPGKSPDAIVSENPKYQPLTDTSEIEKFVDEVLTNNPDTIASYRSGRDKAFAFLVGQVMKMSKGKASPQIVNTLLKEKIAKLPSS
jgi:aspartyl-tRNA(Asn)/glutamyl-tRNA(Gln) amidotransferase subunit B